MKLLQQAAGKSDPAQLPDVSKSKKVKYKGKSES